MRPWRFGALPNIELVAVLLLEDLSISCLTTRGVRVPAEGSKYPPVWSYLIWFGATGK